MGGITTFLPFIIIFVVMYFMMIKPQQKRAKEAQEMLNSLQKGSEVVTIGGLHGIVDTVNDTTIVLDCEGIYLTFERRAIARVVNTSTEVVEEVVEIEETDDESTNITE